MTYILVGQWCWHIFMHVTYMIVSSILDICHHKSNYYHRFCCQPAHEVVIRSALYGMYYTIQYHMALAVNTQGD